MRLNSLRVPDAEPKKVIRSHQAMALTSAMSRWYATSVIHRLEKGKEPVDKVSERFTSMCWWAPKRLAVFHPVAIHFCCSLGFRWTPRVSGFRMSSSSLRRCTLLLSLGHPMTSLPCEKRDHAWWRATRRVRKSLHEVLDLWSIQGIPMKEKKSK